VNAYSEPAGVPIIAAGRFLLLSASIPLGTASRAMALRRYCDRVCRRSPGGGTKQARFTRFIETSVVSTSVLLMKSSAAFAAMIRARILSRFGSGL